MLLAMRRISYFLVFSDLQPKDSAFCQNIFKGLEMSSEGNKLFVEMKYRTQNSIKKKLNFILANDLKLKVGFYFRITTTRYDSGLVLPAYISKLMLQYGQTTSFTYKIVEYVDTKTGAVYDKNMCRIL